MTNDNYQEAFNAMIRDVSEMIEITGNQVLKKLVKKRLYDFSEEIEGGRANGLDKNTDRSDNK